MSESPNSLNELLQQTGLWRASGLDQGKINVARGRSTGFSLLDQALPDQGWPADGVTELLHDQYGIGEFRLLAPTLAKLSQSQSRWLLLVSPPYIPYPPALAQAGVDLSRIVISQPKSAKDYLWVLEKALASQCCSAVMAWPASIQEKQIRRLQVASKEGQCWGLLFRAEQAAINASPAELRIRIRPTEPRRDNTSLIVKILKRKGGWQSDDIRLDFQDQLHRPMPDFSEMRVASQHREIPALLPIVASPVAGNAAPGDSTPQSVYEYQ